MDEVFEPDAVGLLKELRFVKLTPADRRFVLACNQIASAHGAVSPADEERVLKLAERHAKRLIELRKAQEAARISIARMNMTPAERKMADEIAKPKRKRKDDFGI